jgi:hypothetical protein
MTWSLRAAAVTNEVVILCGPMLLQCGV